MPPIYEGTRRVIARYIGSKAVSSVKINGKNCFSGILPSAGRTFLTSKSSLILDEGTGGPTWSRATKAWGFNELGYLEEIASGCAFFGGARLVRNTVRIKSEDFNAVNWIKLALTAPSANTVVCENSTTQQTIGQTAVMSPVVTGQYWRYSVRVRHVAGGVSFIQLTAPSGGFGTGQYANFSLLDGSTVAVGCTSTSTLVGGTTDTYDFSIRSLCLTSGAFDGTVLILVDSMAATRNPAFTGDGIKSFELLRAWSVDVTGYDASYVPEYVSVGVVATPFFGAGIDGAKYFETDWQGAPIAAANLLGFRREAAATNNLLHSRDLSNAAWSTKTNITAAKTATGLDGIASTATTLTATAADAIILQTITLASAARCASAYVKRRTGTGTISFTQDGGSTWTDITSQINSSTWSRVQITSTLADPSVGFKLGTSGDAIDVDCVQNEAGTGATSPIVTTTATVTRNADLLTYQTAGNIDLSASTAYCEFGAVGNYYSGYPIAIDSNGRIIYAHSSDTRLGNYDGANIAFVTTSNYLNGGRVKCASAWGGATKSITVNGSVPVSGAFDGSMGASAVINIGGIFSAAGTAYIGPVAIYNYQMTDAELRAITA